MMCPKICKHLVTWSLQILTLGKTIDGKEDMKDNDNFDVSDSDNKEFATFKDLHELWHSGVSYYIVSGILGIIAFIFKDEVLKLADLMLSFLRH